MLFYSRHFYPKQNVEYSGFYIFLGLFCVKKRSSVQISSGSIRDDLHWNSMENSLETSYSSYQVSLVWVSSCCNTGSIRDGLYWTSRKNSLELIELSSINKVSLV